MRAARDGQIGTSLAPCAPLAPHAITNRSTRKKCAVLRRQVWVLFMMQGEQVVDNVGKVARVAVPMAAYFAILWTGTFLACRAAGFQYGHAVTQVRIA